MNSDSSYAFRSVAALLTTPSVGGRSVRRTILATLAGSCLLTASSAWGQNEFTLTDDDQWEKTSEAEPGTPEGELAAIRTMLAQGDYGQAEDRATRWIERYPNHPLESQAYFARGEAMYMDADYYEALFEYEYIARRHHRSEEFVPALERELEIAKKFLGGLKRKLWGMRIVDGSDVAEELLIRIQERLPRSRLAERAGLVLADWYYDTANVEMATEAYDVFIDKYPDSPSIPKARRRLIYSNLAAFKGPQFDTTGLLDARARLQALKVQDPIAAEELGADAVLLRIDESDAEKLLTTAKWYLRSGDILSADFMLRRLIDRYPTAAATREAVDVAIDLRPRLPQRLQDSAPDYEAIRAALRGIENAETSESEAMEESEGDDHD